VFLVPGQRDVAPVAVGFFRILRLRLEVFLAGREPRQRLAVCAEEFDRGAAGIEQQPGAVLLADGLDLPDLERNRLDHEFAHLLDIGRKAAALGDRPALVFPRDRDRVLRLADDDGRDLRGLQALEQRLAECAGVRRTSRTLLLLHQQRTAAQRHKQDEQYADSPGVHADTCCLRRLTKNTARPSRITSSGISAMFATLVQKTSASASCRRFLRSSFSSLRVSVARFLKFSISSCCSGVMSWADFAPAPRAFCSSCSLAVVFCTSSSRALRRPKYCFWASASIWRTTVSGRNEAARLRSEVSASPDENCSTMLCANARLPLEGTTMRRPNTSCTSTAAPSFSMSTSATRITEFSAADSLSDASAFASAAFFGSGSGFPLGNAVLNLPVSRSARGRSLFSGRKPFIAASPDTVETMLSTSIELGELFTSSVTFSPAAGFTSNAPP